MFAMVKTIAAVFVAATSRRAHSDEEIAVTRKQRTMETHLRKLGGVFKELDRFADGVLLSDGSGSLVLRYPAPAPVCSEDSEAHEHPSERRRVSYSAESPSETHSTSTSTNTSTRALEASGRKVWEPKWL